MTKRTTVKEDESNTSQPEYTEIHYAKELLERIEEKSSLKDLEKIVEQIDIRLDTSDRVKELVDLIEGKLKQPLSFRIPLMIDRDALFTYLQVQYKDHIRVNVLPLMVELGELIHE